MFCVCVCARGILILFFIYPIILRQIGWCFYFVYNMHVWNMYASLFTSTAVTFIILLIIYFQHTIHHNLHFICNKLISLFVLLLLWCMPKMSLVLFLPISLSSLIKQNETTTRMNMLIKCISFYQKLLFLLEILHALSHILIHMAFLAFDCPVFILSMNSFHFLFACYYFFV